MKATKSIGGVPTKRKTKTKSKKASQQILPKDNSEITIKLIWFLHGAIKPHPNAKTYKDVPKKEYKNCDFDKLVFFGPNGSYASFNQYNAHNFGELACHNRISNRFVKTVSKDGKIMLRDMMFSVEPKTDPKSFRQGMSVYLCKNGELEKIVDYETLIKMGAIDMQQLLQKSNDLMKARGYGVKQWNLLLACCRVYSPSVKYDANGNLIITKDAPSHFVEGTFRANPELRSSTHIEMETGVAKETIQYISEKRGKTIRNPKETRAETAKRKTRVTERNGRLPVIYEDSRMSISPESARSKSRLSRQFSEDDFYKMLVVED